MVGVGIKDFVDLCHIAHYNVILVSYSEHINKTKYKKNVTRGPFKGIFWGVPRGMVFFGVLFWNTDSSEFLGRGFSSPRGGICMNTQANSLCFHLSERLTTVLQV